MRTQPTQTADLWLLSERQVPDGYHFIALLEQEYRCCCRAAGRSTSPLSWSRPSAIRGSTGSTASCARPFWSACPTSPSTPVFRWIPKT
ncbi:hypothetical protein UMZ34_15375 [Halopseudomonas pachastrellae]|nr:hypothetical protein UMZ34_15375 [Halopseudomonas pachastrellae]